MGGLTLPLPTAHRLRGGGAIVDDGRLRPDGRSKQPDGNSHSHDDLKELFVLHETSPEVECSLGGYPNQQAGFLREHNVTQYSIK